MPHLHLDYYDMNRKRTAFKAGGLKMGTPPERYFAASIMQGDPPPPYINETNYCVETSYQGLAPRCVAYAVAGWIEIHDWKDEGKKHQVDPNPIYDEAKRLDGNNDPGTSIEHGVQAAMNLGLISKGRDMVRIFNRQQMHYALHRVGACLAGFNATEGWNFCDSRTGFIDEKDDTELGAHCVLEVWFSTIDDSEGHQGSWDVSWGCQQETLRGFGRMHGAAFDHQFIYGVAIV